MNRSTTMCYRYEWRAMSKDHLTPRGRAKFRLMGGRYGDFRNWEEIDSWASAVAEDLRRSTQRPATA